MYSFNLFHKYLGKITIYWEAFWKWFEDKWFMIDKQISTGPDRYW